MCKRQPYGCKNFGRAAATNALMKNVNYKPFERPPCSQSCLRQPTTGPASAPNVGAHAKKTTDTLTMTSNKRHIVLQTDFTTGLTRLDQHCNWTTTETTDKEEKRKSPRFAFLKISANAHLAHPAFPTHIANTTKSGKSQILPTLNLEKLINFG